MEEETRHSPEETRDHQRVDVTPSQATQFWYQSIAGDGTNVTHPFMGSPGT